jgi:hypothetical protein
VQQLVHSPDVDRARQGGGTAAGHGQYSQSDVPGGVRHASSGVRPESVTDGKLRGDQISFSAGGVQYTGRVNGNTMAGTFKGAGKTGDWSATRAAS